MAVLATLHQQQPSITVGIVGNDLVVADTPMHKLSASMSELIKKLKDNKVERIAFERGVTQDELDRARAATCRGWAAAPPAIARRTSRARISRSAA